MPKVQVIQSNIQGKGVFAGSDFKKGEVILDIDDSNIVDDQAKLPAEEREWCDYLGDKTVLMQEPERYINHSCEPNTFVRTIEGVRKVIAMRDIKAGEEITGDYAINGYYDNDTPCHCGTSRCRGIISPNFFKLPRERQREYMPYLDDWFVERFKKELEGIKK